MHRKWSKFKEMANHSIGGLLERQSNITPDKLFLSDTARSLSYQEFYEATQATANYLLEHCALLSGDRVLIMLEHSIEFYLSFFSVIVAGGVAVPISYKSSERRVSYIIGDCKPKIIFAEAEIFSLKKNYDYYEIDHEINFVSEGRAVHGQVGVSHNGISRTILFEDVDVMVPASILSDTPSMIVYTSGSSGSPKGVVSSHMNVLAASESIAEYLDINETDNILNCLPPFFDYGLYQSIICMQVGASLYIKKNFFFIDELAAWVEENNITGLPLVPTMAASILKYSFSRDAVDLNKYFDSLRFISSTGAPFYPYIGPLNKLFPKVQLFSMYGLTECKRVSYLPCDEVLIKPMSVGIPMNGVDVKIVDDNNNEVPVGVVGTLIVRGPNVCLGYWNDSALTKKIFRYAFAEKMYLYTNDKFRQDSDGYLYYVGREDGVIKSGGMRISTVEVTNILCEISEVSEAFIITEKNEYGEDDMHAFVSIFNHGTISTRAVRQRMKSLVDHNALLPKTITILKNIPKTENGKICKQSIERIRYGTPAVS